MKQDEKILNPELHLMRLEALNRAMFNVELSAPESQRYVNSETFKLSAHVQEYISNVRKQIEEQEHE